MQALRVGLAADGAAASGAVAGHTVLDDESLGQQAKGVEELPAVGGIVGLGGDVPGGAVFLVGGGVVGWPRFAG